MDILLENELLIFSKSELIDDDIIRCRDAKEFESRYLRKVFDDQISVIRILDREKENFKISKPYKDKIDIVNIVTSPEIEMLIICSEDKYEEFCKVKSKMSPSTFCKQNMPKLKYDKKYETIKAYFSTPEKLVNAIMLYLNLLRYYTLAVFYQGSVSKIFDNGVYVFKSHTSQIKNSLLQFGRQISTGIRSC